MRASAGHGQPLVERGDELMGGNVLPSEVAHQRFARWAFNGAESALHDAPRGDGHVGGGALLHAEGAVIVGPEVAAPALVLAELFEDADCQIAERHATGKA